MEERPVRTGRNTRNTGGTGGRPARGNAGIEGNVVRQPQTVPAYDPQPRRRGEPQPRRREEPQRKTREEILRERSRKRAVRRNLDRALEMNRGYVAFLTVVTVICFCVSLLYVHVQADNTVRMQEITALENQISELKADNQAAEKRLETSMNLEEVKKSAKKMGFIYPKAEQIRYYTVEDSDYMNQYGKIPSK